MSIARLAPLAVLSLAACQSGSPEAPAIDHDVVLPPPAALTLTASDVVPGQPVVLTVTGATPGDTVLFGAGPVTGSGPCVVAGACLDIDVRQQLGAVLADAAGEATVTTGLLPDILDGAPMGLQAGVLGYGVSQAEVRRVGSTYVAVDAVAGGPGLSAPDPTRWTYVSFEDGVVTPADPATSTAWDLAFQRYWIATNGGTSGPGTTEVVPLSGVRWPDVTEPDPSWTWLEDVADADADGVDEYVLLDWYTYDPSLHRLVPNPTTYVVRTSDGAHHKVALDSYYGPTGTSGEITLHHQRLADARTELVVDASAGGTRPPDPAAWVYVDLDTGAVVTPLDPADDGVWDLAFQRTGVLSNGGTTGTGEVEVAAVTGEEFSDVRAPRSGWAQDGADPAVDAVSPGGVWWDYDLDTHTVSPKADVAYTVRTTDGDTYRVRIDHYADPSTGTSGVYGLTTQRIPDPWN